MSLAKSATIDRADHSTASSFNMPPSLVITRPARGFHRFRNGLLNVTPKGAEKELVKNNQRNSPLLRLPSEIRNAIWHLVLGGSVYRIATDTETFDYVARPQSNDSPDMALLRTCRQVYAEGAAIPLLHNIFSFHIGHFAAKPYLRKLKPHQRRQIKSMQIEISSFAHARPWVDGVFPDHELPIPKWLPALKHFHLVVFDAPVDNKQKILEEERALMELTEPYAQHFGLNITIEFTQQDWQAYVDGKIGTTVQDRVVEREANGA